jgi:hypothetical protein
MRISISLLGFQARVRNLLRQQPLLRSPFSKNTQPLFGGRSDVRRMMSSYSSSGGGIEDPSNPGKPAKPSSSSNSPSKKTRKVTINTLKGLYDKKQPIVMLTAHDYPSALVADSANVDVILVGDSLAMVALGMDTTIPITMDASIL